MQRLGRKLLVRGRKVARAGVQIDINLERPQSLGTVKLRSANPLDEPLIDPNYLDQQKDLFDLVKGVGVMREVMEQKAIRKFVKGELGDWKQAITKDQIIDAIRKTAYTGHHPCSTAKMGNSRDDNSVLDSSLRVKGIENLRICDASSMPTQITGNLYATVVAMAEKASDIILGRKLPTQPELNKQER